MSELSPTCLGSDLAHRPEDQGPIGFNFAKLRQLVSIIQELKLANHVSLST